MGLVLMLMNVDGLAGTNSIARAVQGTSSTTAHSPSRALFVHCVHHIHALPARDPAQAEANKVAESEARTRRWKVWPD